MYRWLRAVEMDGRHVRLLGAFAAAFATALLAPAPGFSADTVSYVLTGAITLPGGDKITSFDISFFDPVLSRYFLANRTSKAIIVVDVTSNQVVAQFKPG